MKQLGGITGKGFVPGDPRINKNGRPRVFDELRALATKIANEKITVKIGEKSVEMTRAEAILRQWAASKNPVCQQNFITTTYGKVPDEFIINPQSKVTIEVKYVDGTDGDNLSA